MNESFLGTLSAECVSIDGRWELSRRLSSLSIGNERTQNHRRADRWRTTTNTGLGLSLLSFIFFGETTRGLIVFFSLSLFHHTDDISVLPTHCRVESLCELLLSLVCFCVLSLSKKTKKDIDVERVLLRSVVKRRHCQRPLSINAAVASAAVHVAGRW